MTAISTPVTQTPTIQERLLQYQRDGYTVFERHLTPDQMQLWREKFDQLHADTKMPGATPSAWFGNMLEKAPALMWPVVSDPTILGFLESAMGPFVQLDNLTLAAFSPIPIEQAVGKVSGWHRDRWGHFPTGHYARPLAANAISYLQDLTPDFGPLRVITGSHIEPVAIDRENQGKPHAEELVIHAKAGDVVVTHNNLLHTGTPNCSGKLRYFFSIYFNHSWLKSTDNFAGPACQELIAKARQEKNPRLLRLLGVDEQLAARNNWAFMEPEEGKWAKWIEEDTTTIAR